MKKTIIGLLTVLTSVSFAAGGGKRKSAAPTAAPAPVAETPHRAKGGAKFSRPYGMAGCGLGSVALGKRGAQLFAGTTNGSSGNQTFGITSGTSNCVDTPSSEVAGRMDQFILVNRSQVQGDIARGQGETIAAIGQYMGCASSSNEIGSALKSNYPSIFTSEAPVNEVTDGIISTIMANPELAKSCQRLG